VCCVVRAPDGNMALGQQGVMVQQRVVPQGLMAAQQSAAYFP